MRDWGRLRHNGHSLWWSILARNKRSVTLNLRDAARPGARAAAVRRGRRRGRELPARHDGEVGPRARRRARARARRASTRACRATARPAATATAPGFASAGEAIGGLRHINGYPGQAPPRSGISLGDTLAAQSAFQGILLALYARDVRGAAGQVVDASITDACFAMTESTVVEYEKTGFVREPTGPRLPRIAPSNVYRSSDGKWVVIAANHDTLWKRLAALMGRPELGEDERFDTHHARGEHEDELDELIGDWAARHTAAELDRIVNEGGRGVRAGLLRRRHPRRPALPRARAAGRARGRGARRDQRARRRAEAERDAGRDPPGRALDRRAPTPTRCWASWAWTATASTSCEGKA